MESDNSSNNDSDSSNEKNNAPPVAIEHLNNINNLKINDNDSKGLNLKICISPFYLERLKKEHYIELIKFIKKYCDLTLKENFLFNIDIFRLAKRKIQKTENFYYKLSLLKEERERIKIEEEKTILETHKEIKKNSLKEIQKILNMHSNYNSNKKSFECKIHNKIYSKQEQLYNHYKSRHRYHCLHCGDYFPSIIKIHDHFGYCFSDNIDNFNQYMNINLKNNSIQNKNEIKSSEFGQIIVNEKSNKANNNIVNKDINKEEDKIEVIKEIIKENDIINNKYKHKQKKQGDMKIKEDIKVEKKFNANNYGNSKEENAFYYECFIDGRKFQTEKSYIKHFEKQHPLEYPFYCDQCKRGFNSYNAIENHITSKGH